MFWYSSLVMERGGGIRIKTSRTQEINMNSLKNPIKYNNRTNHSSRSSLFLLLLRCFQELLLLVGDSFGFVAQVTGHWDGEAVEEAGEDAAEEGAEDVGAMIIGSFDLGEVEVGKSK